MTRNRIVDALAKDEYTGDDRCTPCTAVNLAFVVALAGATAPVSPVLSGSVLAVGVVAVWLRGYVVPYTPAFAPRLVAALPGGASLFDHDDRTPGGLGDGDAVGQRVLADLRGAGVLVGDDELRLAGDFRRDWRAAMRDVEGEDLVAAVSAAAPEIGHAHRHADGEKTWVVVSDADRSVASERWLARPVAVADVAAVRALADRGVDRETAVDAAGPLRLFLEECPDCGGGIVETTGGSCCGGFGLDGPDRVLACADCDQYFATLD